MKWPMAIYGVVLVVAVVGYGIYGPDRTIANQRNYLLKEIDHVSVATACLEMLTNSIYRDLIGKDLMGNDPSLPPSIRAISPKNLRLDRDEVTLVHGGGHYAFYIYFRPCRTNAGQFELIFQDEADSPGADNDPVVLLHLLKIH